MPVVEKPVTDLLTFQVWDAQTQAWRDLRNQANTIRIKRGGDQSGASTSLKAGTLDATLVGALNLGSDPALRPNAPIRVIRADGGAEFTGTIFDIDQQIDLDKSTNRKTVLTTLSAVDPVQSLADTDRYGVIADNGTGRQSWTERLNQLAQSSLVPMDVPASTDKTVYSLPDSGDTDGWAARNNTSSGNTTTTLTPVSGGALRARISRTTGTDASVVSPEVYRQFRNLDPRSTYAFAVTVTLSESTMFTPGSFVLTWKDARQTVTSDVFTLSDAGQALTIGLQFKPAAQIGTLGLYGRDAGAFASGSGSPAVSLMVTSLKVTSVGDPAGLQLQDVAYESSLLNHIDLACNSVGARWWVAKNGRVQFARELTGTTPVLSIGDTSAQDVSYTDASLRYDTRNVVNAVKLNQHGYDPASGNALDSATTIRSETSIRRWGIRASSLETCLYLGAGHEQDLVRRGQALLGPLSRPVYAVSRFTINVQSNPAVLPNLELRALIRVVYEGIVQTCRVLSIDHTISPTRWEVTVTVSDIRTGPTFADFNAVTPGTFAAFDAAFKGKSFVAFDADPTLGKVKQ
ncbi:hypothetical protein HUN59_04615 [Curtobacterium sp. Csp2]|uniref:hypothetical protein n=1 Tax=Curtobacterium sp. Csp2 TaxID=2495430 RepID=UPI00158011A5|nr:hypothetical protein [Curtobacterium sp. Csp2]QKS15594.1 hypothetical protein HUN59_04615 [Curtobacterium sp. Csp2]